MKLRTYLMGLIGAGAFASCSSDPPSGSNSDPLEIGNGENFISVAIEMPSSVGSRATVDSFDDGVENESKVNNIVFFFFDEAGNCIEVQKIDNPVFSDPAQPSQNPNITNYGTMELRLKAGLKYNKVAVALNSPAQNATELKSQIASISDLLGRTYKYTDAVQTDGSGQVMSNSVYYAMNEAKDTPTSDKKVDVIEITSKNIYTSAQKVNIDALIAAGTKEYVNIFVERVLAKVNVSEAAFNMEDYYVIEDAGQKKNTLTLLDHVNNTSREITVQPVVKGMILNVLTPKTALVKPLQIEEVGYQNGEGEYKNFQWNDPVNKRSYWASTALTYDAALEYKSWNDAVARGSGAFTAYIHPNTQDFKPVRANEGSSLNTKIMVVAQLCMVEDGVVKEDQPLDFVMFGADYMLSSAFIPYVANIVNRDIRNIDWDSADLNLGEVTLTEAQKKAIKDAVDNAFVTGYGVDDFKLAIGAPTASDKFGDEDWAAEISLKDGVETPSIQNLPAVDGVSGETLFAKVIEVVVAARNATLERINANRILYWKEGRTYFYANIRHQGFTGLTGQGTSDFLYGVVRNHWYKISLDGIYGLGTPVIDPAKPINPDRPNDDRPSYIKAKINILPWRVVVNNATIH